MVSWPPARDRGQPGRDGGSSPRSTRCGSSLNMTSWMIRARGARCFAGKAFIPRISPRWRQARDKGAAGGLAEKPAGRPGRDAADAENERLRKENEKIAAELARTKAAPEVVGKAHALLELLSESADSDAKRRR